MNRTQQIEQYQIDVFDDEEFDALETQILQLTNSEKNQIIIDSLQNLHSKLTHSQYTNIDPCICGMLSLLSRTTFTALQHLITLRYLESKWADLPTYTRIAIHSKGEYYYNLNHEGTYRFTNLKDRISFIEAELKLLTNG